MLSTHVLDTAAGRPAAGMAVTLIRDGLTLKRLVLNADGRAPLLAAEEMQIGVCSLRFEVAAYFRAQG